VEPEQPHDRGAGLCASATIAGWLRRNADDGSGVDQQLEQSPTGGEAISGVKSLDRRYFSIGGQMAQTDR
jgi:hypothetical protein